MISKLDSGLVKLIQFYVETREVYSFEMALEKLVETTNLQNYMHIVTAIDQHPKSSELDLSMYIFEIASEQHKELESIINKKLDSFQDADAIEDLKEALIKVLGDK